MDVKEDNKKNKCAGKSIKRVSTLSSANIFGESFEDKCRRIRNKSPFGSLSTWKLIQVIVKNGCDLRQEQFASQLISQFDQIFQQHKVPIWLKPYEIVSTGPNSGLIQTVADTISLDSLNKKLKDLGLASLNEFFETFYITGHSYSYYLDLPKAKYNFVASLAGYSLVCYVLQIKDRHNGNILLDRDGHMIHIDFDYFISNSPGNNLHFEKAPFKLTNEYIELIEGKNSEYFQYFKQLMIKGIMALQKEYRKIVMLIAMMLNVNQNLPCFVSEDKIIYELQERLFPRVDKEKGKTIPMKEEEAEKFIDQ